MKNNFTIEKVLEGVYKIQEPWFSEQANLYLFQGGSDSLIIDCGMGTFDIKKFLAGEGFLNTKVALTHAHFDHAGGIFCFEPEQLLIHEKIANNLKYKELQGVHYIKPEYFDKEYVASKIGESIEDYCRNYRINLPAGNNGCQSPISVGKFKFEVMNLPGHTDDSIVYYDRTNKILVSGDTLYNGELYCDFPNSDKKKFVESLNYIRELDFDVVLTGHNEILNKDKAHQVIEEWVGELKK